MQYIRLGKSSLKISRIGLGCMGIGTPAWRSWVLGEEEGKALLKRALELEINFFDTCDYYSGGASEEVLGELVDEMKVRDQVVIATKCGAPTVAGANGSGYSRKHIVEAAERSLRRLKTDRIDLYQTHLWDTTANIEEMVLAFDQLVRQGKVLYVGATDIPCWQLAKAVYHARQARLTEFVSLQHHYNALWREDERELVPFCLSEGLGLLPYSPVARGFLAGRQRRLERTTERARNDDYAWSWYGRDDDASLANALEDQSEAAGIRPAQLALAWVLSRQPTASPIVGPTRIGQLEAAAEALSINVAEDRLKVIDDAYVPRRHGGHF